MLSNYSSLFSTLTKDWNVTNYSRGNITYFNLLVRLLNRIINTLLHILLNIRYNNLINLILNVLNFIIINGISLYLRNLFNIFYVYLTIIYPGANKILIIIGNIALIRIRTILILILIFNLIHKIFIYLFIYFILYIYISVVPRIYPWYNYGFLWSRLRVYTRDVFFEGKRTATPYHRIKPSCSIRIGVICICDPRSHTSEL